MIFDDIMDELYNSNHISIQTRVYLNNHLQYDPNHEIYLFFPSLETQYSQSSYFRNVIVIIKFEHNTFKIILNIIQDRNNVYPYSVNPGIYLSSMRGCNINFKGGYLIQISFTPVFTKYYSIYPLETPRELYTYEENQPFTYLLSL